MATIDQIADVPLDPAARSAAAQIVDTNVEAATAALRDAELDDDAYNLCLYHVQVEDEADFSLPPLAIGLERDRRAALARAAPADVFSALHNPEEGGGPWLETDAPLPEEPQRVLAAALRAEGILEPQRWVLCRVARALTLGDQPSRRTDDFVAFVFDQTFDVELIENLRFAAPPDVAAALEAKGLLPRRFWAELEGAGGLDLEEVVADLEEEVDDDMEFLLGRFNGECSVFGAEEGVWDAPLEDALAWARHHTDFVRLTVDDVTYSAGAEPVPGLPVWPEGRTVVRRPLGGDGA